MEPAVATTSNVIGDVGHYEEHAPERWDVVVFRLGDANQSGAAQGRFMKRVVGLPGETIQFTSRGLKINGERVSAPGSLKARFSCFKRFPEYKFGIKPFEIPADTVFVVGDATEIYVVDSRELGPIPIRNLEARVIASALVKAVT